MDISDKLIKLRTLKEKVVSYQDPLHFISNYCLMQHSSKGAIPFTPYDFQMEYLNAITSGEDVIVKGARQTGMTTSALMYILYYAMTNYDKNIILLSHNFYSARDNLDTIRFAFEHLPSFIHDNIEITQDVNQVIKFSNGVTIRASSPHPSVGRGLTVDLMFLDNFTLIEPAMQKEIMECLIPTFAFTQSLQLIMASSMEGDCKIFRDNYECAEKGNSMLKPITLRRQEIVPPTSDLTRLKLTI